MYVSQFSQADWFYGINKPPPAFDSCPPGLIKTPAPDGFRCLPPPPPPPPPPPSPPSGGVDVPTTVVSGPALPASPMSPDFPVDAMPLPGGNFMLYAAGAGVLGLIILVLLLR